MCRERDRPRDPAHDGARRMERLMSTTDPKSSTTPASLPERVGRLALFGPPPLLEGEDTAAYDELLARISGAVKPADILRRFGSEISSTSSGRHSAFVGSRRIS